ncbi:MAG: sel1 repeat family protein [Alphaproteobacteria bacterium]|nr:sel1 repeat family protein [Alphaproteobacteria bacterium]
MYLMSQLLAKGGALPIDAARTTSLLVQAAHAGHMLAQLALGRHYADPASGTGDPVIAARWFLRAAEQGEPAAQVAYGEALVAGRDVEADPAGGRGRGWHAPPPRATPPGRRRCSPTPAAAPPTRSRR